MLSCDWYHQMLNILSSSINNGAKLTIITRPEGDYKEKDRFVFSDMVDSIRLTGANLIFKLNIHQKFAIVDQQQIVWYGSINLLSFGSSEESIMRLNMLAEATTTEISKTTEPNTFEENRQVAQRGGQIAGNTRKEI